MSQMVSSGDSVMCKRGKEEIEMVVAGLSLEYEQSIGIQLVYCDDNDNSQYCDTCPYFSSLNKKLKLIKYKVVDECLLLEQFPSITKNSMPFYFTSMSNNGTNNCIDDDNNITNGILHDVVDDIITLDKIKYMLQSEDMFVIADIVNHIVEDSIAIEFITCERDKQLASLNMYLKAISYMCDNNIFADQQSILDSARASISELLSRTLSLSPIPTTDDNSERR